MAPTASLAASTPMHTQQFAKWPKYATLGPKIGVCNICKGHGPLTEDHVPPKGAIRVTQMEMHHLTQVLGAERPTARGRLSQDGVKFRTLCTNCNSELLGHRYDPELIRFSNTVGSLLKTTLSLPPRVNVRIAPQKVLRALCGHILAFGLDRPANGPFEEALASYFLDETMPFPAGVNLYYWVYPYNSQVLVRDCAMTDLKIREPVVIKTMKYFPLAFMFTWEEPVEYGFLLENLARFGQRGLSEECDLIVDLQLVPPMIWPEAPSKSSFLVYGADAMRADPYGRT